MKTEEVTNEVNSSGEATSVEASSNGVSLKHFVVLIVFVGFVGLFAWALNHDSSELPSQLIDQPVPQFSVVDLMDANQTHTAEIFSGKVSLLNVWASWCAACYTEHPFWNSFSKYKDLQLIGLNYNDKKDKALHFLETQGNPYQQILFDHNGRLGIDFGVYGAPETFLIGPNGKVRYRHVGIVTEEVFASKFQPLIAQIKQGF